MQRNNRHRITERLLVAESALNAEGESARSKVHAPGGLSPALQHILQEVQREIVLDPEGDIAPDEGEIRAIIERISEKLGFALSTYERDEILEQIEKDSNEFGILQDLVDDPKTSDIVVTNYAKISVQQGRRNLSTDVSFVSQDAYESFVERLLQRAGTAYSTKKPIADGMIGAFARVHVVHRCLCESGPYLTIRLNRFPSVNCADLVRFGLAPQAVFDYLTTLIHHGQTLLVVGEVGTGKTTLVRALAASMPAHESILVIEDTPEIRLEHPHVRYISTREPNTDGAGRVAPSECIRAGMRMAMNRIIFGEMRDAEAAESFIDVCASGHPGLSTIHGRSATEAISRLELFLGRAQKGVSRTVIDEQIVKAVQVIVHLGICPVSGKRRILEVIEIGPVADGVVRVREIFTYQTRNGVQGWKIVTRVSAYRDVLEEYGVILSALPELLETAPNFSEEKNNDAKSRLIAA
jgi:pilus assembly protein CpaF